MNRRTFLKVVGALAASPGVLAQLPAAPAAAAPLGPPDPPDPPSSEPGDLFIRLDGLDEVKPIRFSAATDGAVTNVGEISWASVASTLTVSHWSLWNQSTCIGSGTLSQPTPLLAGDSLTILPGDFQVTIE